MTPSVSSTDGPEDVTISPAKPLAFIASGSNFTLSCMALSHPAAVFTWYHNQTMLDVSAPVLSLKDIEKQGYGNQAADYTCRASNAITKRVASSPAVSFTTMSE